MEKHREIIDKHLEKELENKIEKAKIGWDGKQFIIRVPTMTAELIKLNKEKPQWIEFKTNLDTRKMEMKLISDNNK